MTELDKLWQTESYTWSLDFSARSTAAIPDLMGGGNLTLDCDLSDIAEPPGPYDGEASLFYHQSLAETVDTSRTWFADSLAAITLEMVLLPTQARIMNSAGAADQFFVAVRSASDGSCVQIGFRDVSGAPSLVVAIFNRGTTYKTFNRYPLGDLAGAWIHLMVQCSGLGGAANPTPAVYFNGSAQTAENVNPSYSSFYAAGNGELKIGDDTGDNNAILSRIAFKGDATPTAAWHYDRHVLAATGPARAPQRTIQAGAGAGVLH